MSQSWEIFGRDAPKRPYGPNNPPPPPKCPPPSKPDSKRRRDEIVEPSPPPQKPPSTQETSKPRRRSTANQRRKRRLDRERAELEKERAELERSREHWRSRSPSRESRHISHKQRREEWSRRPRDEEENCGRRWGPRYEGRHPLRNARQFTPDQIVDETYGRLSPGEGGRDQYRKPHDEAQHRSDRQDKWSDERSRSLRRSYNRSEGSNGKAIHRDEHHSYDDVNTPYHNRSDTPPIAHASQSFDVEDKVTWDDEDEALDVSDLVPTSSAFNKAGSRPQQAGYVGQLGHAGSQDSKFPVSPPREPHSWQQLGYPWQNKDKKIQRMRFPEYQGNKNGYKPFKTQLQFGNPGDVGRDLGGPRHQQDHTSGRRAATQAPVQNKLLFGDPTLIGELIPEPSIPDTVCDLRMYDAEVTALQKILPRQHRFINGNGKVAPYIYGSIQGQDLGLCFSTFCTFFRCEMGAKCAWRHHPLTKAERGWILMFGRERGRQFLEKVSGFWANPEVPVPGANMHDK